MSFIGKNIKKIRSVRKLSQQKFAELFSLSRTSVGAYEEERAEPKVETIIQIANHFGLSVDVLLTKELSVNDLYNIDLLKQKLNKAHNIEKPVSAGFNPIGVPIIPVKKYVEYIVNHKSKDFLSNLSRVNVPVAGKGIMRAFEMSGSEMEYNQHGLHHGDLLMCKQISTDQIAVEQILVIVTQKEITIRRVDHCDQNAIKLVSDDPNYPTIDIDTNEVLEYWQVKGKYSTYLNPPKLVEEKLLRLEKRIELLEKLAAG
ncbi:MAG: LexA family transcriptional regulator [Cyclobacteriaceae bacterium]